MYHTEEEWRKVIFDEGLRCIFRHDYNPKRPHPKLTSDDEVTGEGYCTDTYFNWRLLGISNMWVMRVATDLTDKLMLRGVDLDGIDRVVGPGRGATTLIEGMARCIQKKRGRKCFHSVSNKISRRPGEIEFDGEPPQPDECILACEDTISTGESVFRSITLAESFGAKTLPYLVAVCNRSGQEKIRGKELIPLFNDHMSRWPQKECPLCRINSRRVRAPDHWQELNAVYSSVSV